MTVDEERGQNMRLVVSRGGAVAFVVEASVMGGADEVSFTTSKANVSVSIQIGQVALTPRIGLCLIYYVGRSTSKADSSNLNFSFVNWIPYVRVGIGITSTVKVTFGCTRVALVKRQPQDNLGLLSP